MENGPSRYTVRVPEAENKWLRELMVRLELKPSQVFLKALRRLAEREGIKPPHPAKRSA